MPIRLWMHDGESTRTERDNERSSGGEERQNNWEVIPITIDSGAVDTVGPKQAGRNFPIRPTKESRAGMVYRGANGSHIENYGEIGLEGELVEGKQQ